MAAHASTPRLLYVCQEKKRMEGILWTTESIHKYVIQVFRIRLNLIPPKRNFFYFKFD